MQTRTYEVQTQTTFPHPVAGFKSASGSRAVEHRDEVPGKPADAVTGRWTVSIDPGDQRGVFRLSLDGAIISGDYSLEGGYTGSLRGTLVNDKLRLERVDSKLGFSAVYVGRVAPDGGSIAGTWESANFGDGGPVQGRWAAVREEEKEGSQ